MSLTSLSSCVIATLVQLKSRLQQFFFFFGGVFLMIHFPFEIMLFCTERPHP